MYISYDTIFFSFDLRHFSLFFFFPIRTPTVTCTGHWIQLQRETWSKHGSNFFITPCEIWREWWVKKKRNQDWCHEVTTVMKETCMYIRHKETKNATTVKQQQQKKKKRKWGAAEQYTTKKGEKKSVPWLVRSKSTYAGHNEKCERAPYREHLETRKTPEEKRKGKRKKANEQTKHTKEYEKNNGNAVAHLESPRRKSKWENSMWDSENQGTKWNKVAKWLDGLWCRKGALTCKNQVIKAMKQVQITNEKKRCSLEVIVTAPVQTARWHDDSGTEWACAQEQRPINRGQASCVRQTAPLAVSRRGNVLPDTKMFQFYGTQ